jgi:hypothetical protein
MGWVGDTFSRHICKFVYPFSYCARNTEHIVQITTYRQIRHSFYSLDNGIEMVNIVRSSPRCYGYVRFDTVLIQTASGYQPARLHLVFETLAYQKQLARVTYFTRVESIKIDRTIGMVRYQEDTKESLFS